jgi:hypothetical protein
LSGLPNGNPKTGTFVVLKLWMLISSSNQTFLKHKSAIIKCPSKDFYNGVLHVPIENDLTFALRGFPI